ncbi:hypothetical protein GYMLUDRAFT_60133 [Collybiopsis luxurians FD-317 M1]|uniref:Unplaced genomic scaffold GYMLUscaffold_31, whole genome shotgun sequence n=1 Tax=Collybiopsis luxurians FD-317 M1 TaxID=944289 RepID=A0A0D0CAV5_9AGAR|nr:hypothetical protein GYMLUDRAFT_60133 [Collybiopsis luxurians FD-317 M1]
MRAMIARYKHVAVNYRTIELDLDNDPGESTLPRRPRHVTKSEAYGIMATHAEWFLAQQLVTHHRKHIYVNLKLWHDFCIKAKKIRKRKNWDWGEPYAPKGKKQLSHQLQSPEELVDNKYIDLSRFGSVHGGWEKRIEKHINVEFPAPGESDHSEGFGADQDLNEDEDDHGRPEYESDMDFLAEDPALPPDSDSDSDFDPEEDEWLLKVLPQWSDAPIEWFPGQVEWHCPQDDCDFKLNFTDIRPSTAISEDELIFLREEARDLL